ncbi:putative sulfide-quinone reductase [Mycobacterium xenopi 3993]|nr:putative sulfide-quinone reductase [Mycobacterium xenopi 3993]
MEAKKVLIPLKPIYQRKGIVFHQALATAIRPEGTGEQSSPSVDFTYTDEQPRGETGSLTYDYLINATGPQLNFAATPGLGLTGTHTRCAPPGTPSRRPRRSTKSSPN